MLRQKAEPAFDSLLFSAVVCGFGRSSRGHAFPSEYKGVIVLAGRQGSTQGKTTKLGDPPVTREHWHEPWFDAFSPKCTAPKASHKNWKIVKKKKQKTFSVQSMVTRFTPLGKPL